MNKIALPTPIKVENDEDLKTAANLIAENELKLREMTAGRDRSIQSVQDAKNPDIDALSKAVESLVKPAKSYIKKHKKRILQDGKKTFRTELAVVKMRTSPAKISTIGKVKQDDVALALGEQGLYHLITTSVSLNKAALMKLSDEQLAEYSLKKSTTETISLGPITDELER